MPEQPEPLWMAILKCADCGCELNRAEHVPESAKAKVTMTSALAAKSCPNGCRATFSDCNINTKLDWSQE